MKKVLKSVLTAIFLLLAISMAVNAQGNGTNVTNASSYTAYGNITQNANNVTSPPHAPGFEGIFVITGLASAAYLALRRKR